MKIDNSVAIVTGAGGGIGAALCRRLVENGARVVATDLDGERLDKEVAAIRAVPTDEILAAQAGLIADLDAVRDVLYAPFAAT